MAQIIPKLNLNKTPALVENNSLVFAKNIRLDVDGTIHKDYGVFPMSISKRKETNGLVDYKNIIKKIISDIGITNFEIQLKHIQNNGKIVGVIADSNDFYLFIYGTYNLNNTKKEVSRIVKYSEKEDKFYICKCNWNWSGGTVEGCVIKNLIGDTILNIGEYDIPDLVPFKSINLNTATIHDDESIYTQIPNIPITNIDSVGRFSCVIPNGVYQFFVRYKIHDNFYTNWFPASKELFVGNTNSVITSFGSVKYVNINRDSDNSFVLSVEHLISDFKNNYQNYQIGFILTHDDATYARAWKHFDFNTTIVNFDYKAEDAEEIEVTDLLKVTYGLYNIGNITTFKNKLYISNYTESNFNDDSLQDIANNIEAEINTQNSNKTYAGVDILTTPIAGEDVISGLKIDGNDTPFSGENGIFNIIVNSKISETQFSIKEAINNAITGAENSIAYPKIYNWITITCAIENLGTGQQRVQDNYKDSNSGTTIIKHSFDFSNKSINKVYIDDKQSTINDIIPSIYNKNIYLNKNCSWIDSNGKIKDSITIRLYRTAVVTTKITTTDGKNQGLIEQPDGDVPAPINSDRLRIVSDRPGLGIDDVKETITTTNVSYYQDITIRYVAWKNQLNGNDASNLIDYTTLIPYQKYKFYIHFVKSSGEITNGYYCENIGEIEIDYKKSCNSVIYPIFKNIVIPDCYVACFFSISHTENQTSTIFNIKNNPDNNSKEGSCIDIDMMLIPGDKNIHIIQEDDEGNKIETYDSKYYYSSDASIPRYFGANGVVVFNEESFDNEKLAYFISKYVISESNNIELIKCTPYLNKTNLIKEDNKYIFNDYTKMNLLGFICGIVPLDRDTCINYYTDGSGVYRKIINSDDDFHLNELSKYTDASEDERISQFKLKTTNIEYIYSNFNLNYVTLSENPKMSIKTYYNRTSDNTTDTSSGQNIILRLFSSQLLSGLYELPSMYKTYIRKTYSIYKDNEVIRFDNTIRSSILYGDESKIYVIKFEANDYYNVPTNRGIIINMVAIGDAILVHTQDSMFKFSGSNSLQSSEGEILTAETQPFDTGISEMFGSDFGFAGLQNKTDHIITENGYIFFDRDSNIIYLYSGQGQIIRISETIEKLFRHKPIYRINFANDYYNNRFFVCIQFYNEEGIIQPVTLSFNTSENSKAFVSIHDFYFNYAFNTKTKCYFLTLDNKDICNINKDYKSCYTKLALNVDDTYPQIKEDIKLNIYNTDNNNSEIIEYDLNSYNSIIDVINNEQFERVKTLNSISWCGNKVKQEFVEVDENNITTLMISEDVNYEIPCSKLRIYSDSCITPLLNCEEISNDYNIKHLNSYKLPRYNQGVWSFNYFRNIINSNGNVNPYISDQNSLIEGKYFVARFIFNSDFKFETLTFNTDIKI